MRWSLACTRSAHHPMRQCGALLRAFSQDASLAPWHASSASLLRLGQRQKRWVQAHTLMLRSRRQQPHPYDSAATVCCVLQCAWSSLKASAAYAWVDPLLGHEGRSVRFIGHN